MNSRIDTDRILDAYLAPEADRLPDRVIDAALAGIARTPQRRALRVPWRFPLMTNTMRVAAAGVAIVAIVAVGLLALNFRSSGVGGVGPAATASPPPPSPRPSLTPGASPATPAPSQVAPGITGWMPYTSAAYGFRMSYPSDWTVDSRATRGDPSSSDVFMNPEAIDGDQIGLFVSNVPVGKGARPASLAGLKAWAQQFCLATAASRDGGASGCTGWKDRAIPMCYAAGGNPCRAAIIVPEVGGVSAFFEDWNSTISGPPVIRAVSVARPDNFPAAARYGGAIQLLKSILTTMDVTAPAPGQVPGG